MSVVFRVDGSCGTLVGVGSLANRIGAVDVDDMAVEVLEVVMSGGLSILATTLVYLLRRDCISFLRSNNSLRDDSYCSSLIFTTGGLPRPRLGSSFTFIDGGLPRPRGLPRPLFLAGGGAVDDELTMII